MLVCRDLPLLRDPSAVNASFLALPVGANGFPSNATLYQFLSENFNLVPGSDFDEVTPDDFSADPEGFLPNVTDPDIRSWALSVNGLWQSLCREVSLQGIVSMLCRLFLSSNEIILPWASDSPESPTQHRRQ